jgi:hypothetical protein
MKLIPQDALDGFVAVLRDGRDYYRHAATHAGDPELQHAFEVVAEARDKLLASLRDLPQEEALITPSDAALDRNALPENQRYDLLRRQFDPAHPAAQADAVLPRERATLQLAETVFRSHPSMALRRLMKRHYPGLQQSAAIMQRLAQRAYAA